MVLTHDLTWKCPAWRDRDGEPERCGAALTLEIGEDLRPRLRCPNHLWEEVVQGLTTNPAGESVVLTPVVADLALRGVSLQRFLEELGLDVVGTSRPTPVQAWGKTPDGRWFYFRLRGTKGSLSVWRVGAEPMAGHLFPFDEEPEKVTTEERWEWPNAGHVSDEEAAAVFLEMWGVIGCDGIR